MNELTANKAMNETIRIYDIAFRMNDEPRIQFYTTINWSFILWEKKRSKEITQMIITIPEL